MDGEELEKAAKIVRDMLDETVRDRYSDEVLKNWLNPEYMGEIERPDGFGKLIGSCGDEMAFFLRVRDEKITNVKFSTAGCITSIAAGNEGAKLISGRTIDEALMLTASDILEALDGLPSEDEHCAQLATDVIKEAIRDYFLTKREPWRKDY
ncbi:MAG: iron-sulfur cluster assembly scaffold protein [Syntrophaceae bacterium]|nr:iron-sulfur cluster assembly scaffold protein [Syntrophaceae bacterium]